MQEKKSRMPKKGGQIETPDGQIIVVGAGLAGLVAVHSILEAGGRVVLIEKSSTISPPLGNAALTTTGISGAGTRLQSQHEEMDSVSEFVSDVIKSGVKKSELSRTLCENSGDAINWLSDTFGIPFVLSRSAGHTVPRTHKCKTGGSGYVLTDTLARAAMNQEKVQILTGTRVQSLIRNDRTGEIQGVVFEKDGILGTMNGPVVIATGGYGADFVSSSLLAQYRPDLFGLSTACSLTSTGDGIKMAELVGAKTIDMMYVQLNPTGLVDESNRNSRCKLLASQSLRGDGGIILDRFGNRFVNELSKRDMLSQEILRNADNGPFRIVVNSRMSGHLKDHIEEYKKVGLICYHETGADLALKMGIPPNVLEQTFAQYNTKADAFGKEHFRNAPFDMSDSFHSAMIEPVIHYCNGGLFITCQAEVVGATTGAPIPRLYAAGEVTGGVHSCVNPLAGNDLLDCVVFGKIAGISAARDFYGSDYVDGFIDPATIQVNLEKRIAEETSVKTKRLAQLAEAKNELEATKKMIDQQRAENDRLIAASGCTSIEDAKKSFATIQLRKTDLETELEEAKRSVDELVSMLSEKKKETETCQKKRRKILSENEKLQEELETLRNSSSVIRDIHLLEDEIEEYRQRQMAAETEKKSGEESLAVRLERVGAEIKEFGEKRDELYVMMQLENVENKHQLNRLKEITEKWKPFFEMEQNFAAKSLLLAQNIQCPIFQRPYRMP